MRLCVEERAAEFPDAAGKASVGAGADAGFVVNGGVEVAMDRCGGWEGVVGEACVDEESDWGRRNG